MKFILLLVLFFPAMSVALDCESRDEVIEAIKQTDIGALNLHIFRSYNLNKKDFDNKIKKCSWGKVEFFEYVDYETYPAFKAQFKCNGLTSPYIELTGTCHEEIKSLDIYNIYYGVDEGQFP